MFDFIFELFFFKYTIFVLHSFTFIYSFYGSKSSSFHIHCYILKFLLVTKVNFKIKMSFIPIYKYFKLNVKFLRTLLLFSHN